MTRAILNPFDEVAPVQKATASAEAQTMVAEAAVDNSQEGICPKCRRAMGTGYIATGTVYYCTPCRVAAPIPEA